jgi:cytochrome c biogenesis protein CcmG, thiol:disulfide interchange protein DsbE
MELNRLSQAHRTTSALVALALLALGLAVACEDRPSLPTTPEERAAPEPTVTEIVLPTEPGHPWDGEPGALMPEYVAQTLEGGVLSLSELRGDPVVLNFWATWCVPCREEFPVLSELQSRLGPSGLRVLGVSLDGQASADDLRHFAQSNGLDYTVLHDPEMAAQDVFGVPPIPGSFVFDREGRLVFSAIGGGEGSIAELVVAAEAVSRAPGAER